MTDMKIQHAVVWLCLGCAVIAECVHLEPTLDEAIDALPDEWGPHFNAGASSNNYAVLDRVIAETNVQERIRLAWKLFNHFRHTPEWYVEHLEGGNKKRGRHDFFGKCARTLIFGTNSTPETVIAGWKMEAETIRDLDEIIKLTGAKWQDAVRKRLNVRIDEDLKKKGIASGSSDELEFAYEVRWRHFRFFHLFAGSESYVNLPDEMKPSFVEQLKRDFFIYNSMTNAFMMEKFPPELKAAYLEVRKQMELERREGND